MSDLWRIDWWNVCRFIANYGHWIVGLAIYFTYFH